MAKSLSLKKGPPKNQKAITQFFKNATNGPSQPVPTNAETSQSSELKSSEVSSNNKRKASSPPFVDIVSKIEGSSSKTLADHKSQAAITKNSPKKIKLQQSNKQKVSSQLENTNIKTHKESENIQIKEKENLNQASGKLNIEIADDKINRSPLASVIFDCNSESFDSAIKSLENEVNDCIHASPKKKLENKDILKNKLSNESCRVKTPKKSPVTELRRSPRIAKQLTPKKTPNPSPSKNGVVVKALDFDKPTAVGDDFGEEWELNDFEEEVEENLDFSVMQRCEVLNIIRHPTQIELKLKNASNNRGTCFIEGFWLDTPLSPGEIVSVLAPSDASGKFCVSNTSGLLVLRPDHLLSSTSVVAGVFCKRKAVLQERWRGIDSANTAMTIGTLIHELVQKVLTENISDLNKITAEADKIIAESIQMLYDAGLSQDEVRSNMQAYISPLAEFMQTYVANVPSNTTHNQKGKWQGHINKILDIEENLCCPQLGLKGKIDATLEVTIHGKKGNKEIVPLELKSGKASVSAEHRGQLVLYGMMLALQRGEDPARAAQRGLLLYLKDRVQLSAVSCGHPERRDLLILRNQLAQYLAAGPVDVDPEQITDIEDAQLLLQQRLPEPIHRENVCSKCPYLTICSLHLWHTDGPTVSEEHPLSALQGQALGHLSPAHIKYFLHWAALLKAEERVQAVTAPLHSLWTADAEKREKRGTCAANLLLKSVENLNDRYLHVFLRQDTKGAERTKTQQKGPQDGEFCIVSIDKRPWIAAGVVTCANETELHMLLERDLSRRLAKNTQFHVDTYESYATTVQNLTNLGVLMEDSDRALRLRRLIIDKEPPEFESKLSRTVGRLGARLMRGLNVQQQRGVLRALAARHYTLMRGLPGTGKTQTISVLIQMLVALNMRVLVTAHTHSAVDNVLARLPETMKVMRLGPKTRVAAKVAHRCELLLAADCDTPLKLEQLYDSMEVVGVTCLGANHAMLARTSFDMCIVDEATQVPQCTVLRPLFAAKRFVLVGDPDQLPPVIRSKAARRLGMEESLFHRLMCEQATATLQLQYRMNAPLAALANRVAYRGQLECAGAAVADARIVIRAQYLESLQERASWLATACSPTAEHAAVFLDVQADDPDGGNCSNRHEAAVVLALVDAFIEGGIPGEEIGVIAPYREQVSLVRRALNGRAEASTVDQFQGRDKRVILLTATRRLPRGDWLVKEGEVLNDQRRLAVSVTRAKHKLVVIGDSRALRRYEPFTRLIDACETVAVPAAHIAREMDRYSSVLCS